MFFWLGIAVAIILLAVVAIAVAFYLPYRLSPETKWRVRIERCMADAEKRVGVERRKLQEAALILKREERALRRRAFDSFLQSLSATELEAYPGIGPGTVSKLRSAGFTNLAMLQNVRIRVRGLGAKRLADIKNAVGDSLKQAQSRFEAGACHEAQELRSQLEALRAKHGQQEYIMRARVAGAEEVLAKMRPLLNEARKISFFRYLRSESEPRVSAALFNAPLPDVEKTIQAAEQRAAAASASRSEVPGADYQTASVMPPVQPEPRMDDWQSAPSRSGIPVVRAAGGVSVEVLQKTSLSTSRLGQPSHTAAISNNEITELTEPRNMARLEVTIEFAYVVARADGRIARKEKEIIEQYIRRQFGNDPALLNRIRAFYAHYESAAIDVEKSLQRITNLFTEDERRQLLDFAGVVADAAGPRNQREVELLEKVSSKLGIRTAPQQAAKPQNLSERRPETAYSSPERVSGQPEAISVSHIREAKPGGPATFAERLAVLEIDAAVPLSAELVRRQFNLLSQRYAPDKFEAMGSEFVAVAENKRAALLAAATSLMEQWGETLETVPFPSQPPEIRHNPDLDAILGA